MIPDKQIFDLSEKGLLESVKKDERTAFKELYRRYWSKLYIYAYNVLKDKNTCEDIIQEVFTDLWLRRKNLQIENLSAFLYKAVKFQIFKQFRQKKLIERHTEQFEDFISEHRVEESVEYKELNKRIENLTAQLPEQRRIIFRMSRNEELSNKEIAKKLNLSVQTVKNQISHALKSIRDSFKVFIAFFF
ncbi:MAG: RNA polymerase sigma-70 factor [Bacteroidetes bacterium]|nr:RNA polymerase sigma-70 factor [Bacteroidota bacterium]MCL6099174.1 RNA polymerase sigma-70 factor [Bacteroidota bacterium]